EAQAAFRRLEERASAFSEADQEHLWHELALGYSLVGANQEAARAWRRWAEIKPDVAGARLVLFDLALQADNHDGMEQNLKAITSIEGTDSPMARSARASYLIWNARQGNKALLDEARTLLAAVSHQRPGWARLAVSEGQIEELAGNPERAIVSYQR